MQLFIFYIGGTVPGAHLELHDMRFCVGETAEQCWPQLKEQWWGTPESLHLDAWGPISHADGHAIQLKPEAPSVPSANRLWFVHLGGYDSAQFTELHHNALMVAPDERAAKKKALTAIAEWESPHKDAVMDVDLALDLSKVPETQGLHLHLEPVAETPPFQFEARYVPIGKMNPT